VFDWITGLIARMGYFGIAMLMFLENVVPPIPSELIMPLAGFVASKGEMRHVFALIAGTAGSFIGAYLWFYAARRIGERRLRRFVYKYGKWVALSCADIDVANHWFQRRGAIAVFIGRLIPGVRTFISVPAGLSSMSALKFSFYTLLGTVLWTGLLLLAGHILRENFELVSGYVGVLSNVVFAIFAATLVWRYVQQWRRRNDDVPDEDDCEAAVHPSVPSI
jgi:membrane protein DedA with SNARE-associated domain